MDARRLEVLGEGSFNPDASGGHLAGMKQGRCPLGAAMSHRDTPSNAYVPQGDIPADYELPATREAREDYERKRLVNPFLPEWQAPQQQAVSVRQTQPAPSAHYSPAAIPPQHKAATLVASLGITRQADRPQPPPAVLVPRRGKVR